MNLQSLNPKMESKKWQNSNLVRWNINWNKEGKLKNLSKFRLTLHCPVNIHDFSFLVFANNCDKRPPAEVRLEVTRFKFNPIETLQGYHMSDITPTPPLKYRSVDVDPLPHWALLRCPPPRRGQADPPGALCGKTLTGQAAGSSSRPPAGRDRSRSRTQ